MNRPTFLRRSTALLLTLVLMVCAALPGFAAYQMPIQTASDTESVYLFNLDTGKPILRQNSDQQRYIASLTKMMTALLFLESGKAGERSRDGQREGEGQSGRPAEECGLHERILPKIKSFQQLVPEREKRFFRGLGCGGVQQRFVGKGPIEELGGLAEDVLAVGA